MSKLSHLPWKVVLVLLAGVVTLVAGLRLTDVETRSGYAPASVEIMGDTHLIEGDLGGALGATLWRDPIDLVVYVGDIEGNGSCLDTVTTCLGEIPGLLTDFGGVADGTAALWLNPERSHIDISVGFPIATIDSDSALRTVEHDVSTAMSLSMIQGSLDAAGLADGLQMVADVHAGKVFVSGLWSWVGAIAMALVVMSMLSMALSAWTQWRSWRYSAGELGRLSIAERRQKVARVRDTFTRASSRHEEMRLLGLEGDYGPTMRERLAQWERHYADFARDMVAVRDDEELASLQGASTLGHLTHDAELIDAGMTELWADDALMAGRSSEHPAPARFDAALRGVTELAAAMNDRNLAARVQAWRDVLSERGHDLVVWDEVARQIAMTSEPALAAYESANGAEFASRDIIEAPARIRCLDTVAPETNAIVPRVDGEALIYLSDEAQDVEETRAATRLPVSPMLIAIASPIALLVGILAAWLAIPGDPGPVAPGAKVSGGFPPVMVGLLAGLACLAIIVVAAMYLSAGSRRRRFVERDIREIRSTMTSLSLGYDALSLEMAYVGSTFPDYPSAARFRIWEQGYASMVRSMPSQLESLSDQQRQDLLLTMRTLRVQVESLWRIRPILETTEWAGRWDDEVALVYVSHGQAGDQLGRELASLTSSVASGQISTREALTRLDDISASHPQSAFVRCQEGGGAHLAALASRGVLSLESVSEDVVPDYSFDLDIMTYLRDKVQKFVDLDAVGKVLLATILVAGFLAPNLLTGGDLPYGKPTEDVRVDRKASPHVTVADGWDVLDEIALSERLLAMSWSGHTNVVVYSARVCTPNSGIGMDVSAYPSLIGRERAGKVYPRADVLVACVNADEMIVRTNESIVPVNLTEEFLSASGDMTEKIVSVLESSEIMRTFEVRSDLKDAFSA